MSASHLRTSHWIAILLADTVLLGCFLAQTFILGCFLLYGGIPLPKSFVESFLCERLVPEIVLTASAYRIDPSGSITVQSPTLHVDSIESPIFEASNAVLTFEPLRDTAFKPKLSSVLVVGGTIYLPSIHSPTGTREAILEQASFSLNLQDENLILNSFAALHEDVRLRGTATYESQKKKNESDAKAPRDWTTSSFQRAARLIREKSKLEGLTDPAIYFNVQPDEQGSYRIETQISSRKLVHEVGTVRDFSLNAQLELQNFNLDSDSSIFLSASEARFHSQPLKAKKIRCQVSNEQWSQFLNDGRLPNLDFMVESITFKEFTLNHTAVQLETANFPTIDFAGNTGGLDSILHFHGVMQPYEGFGEVRIAGSFGNSNPFCNFAENKLLSSLHLHSEPYIDLTLRFSEGFSLSGADIFLHVPEIEIGGLRFDTIQAQGNYKDELFDFHELTLTRDRQWVDFALKYDAASKDYSLGILGSAIPSEYNALLPSWWAPLFRAFDFSETKNLLGDFIIYGNTKQRAVNMFFGHVDASQVKYRDVSIKDGSLFLRGRGPYAEIFDLDAKQADGWAKGRIQFSSRLDDIRGPESIRLDLSAKLSLEDAGKLFDKNISSILSDFKTDTPINAVIEGNIFSSAYPERNEFSYIDVSANTPHAISYNNLPLESLSLNLYGRKGAIYLRNLEIGFLEGLITGDADIITTHGEEAQLRLKATLNAASQNRLKELLSNWNKEVKMEANLSPAETTTAQDGEIDLSLHAIGPVQNPYAFKGEGDFSLANEHLGSIQIFGPISRMLERANIGFTSFTIDRMAGSFKLGNEILQFDELTINGPKTKIEAPGMLNLNDHSLAMRVSVFLFENAGNPDSTFRKFTEILSRPFPNLLEFELTGTIEDQKLRSLYDPRKLIQRP